MNAALVKFSEITFHSGTNSRQSGSTPSVLDPPRAPSISNARRLNRHTLEVHTCLPGKMVYRNRSSVADVHHTFSGLSVFQNQANLDADGCGGDIRSLERSSSLCWRSTRLFPSLTACFVPNVLEKILGLLTDLRKEAVDKRRRGLGLFHVSMDALIHNLSHDFASHDLWHGNFSFKRLNGFPSENVEHPLIEFSVGRYFPKISSCISQHKCSVVGKSSHTFRKDCVPPKLNFESCSLMSLRVVDLLF